MRRSSCCSLVIILIPRCRCSFSSARAAASHGEDDASRQAHLQNVFTGTQASTGGKNLTHKFHFRVSMSTSPRSIVLAFTSESGRGERAADGAPVRKRAKAPRLMSSRGRGTTARWDARLLLVGFLRLVGIQPPRRPSAGPDLTPINSNRHTDGVHACTDHHSFHVCVHRIISILLTMLLNMRLAAALENLFDVSVMYVHSVTTNINN